jgi:hypothetical protein
MTDTTASGAASPLLRDMARRTEHCDEAENRGP